MSQPANSNRHNAVSGSKSEGQSVADSRQSSGQRDLAHGGAVDGQGDVRHGESDDVAAVVSARGRNVDSARRRKTEDVLESLHRTLKEQAVSRSLEAKLLVVNGTLSGGKARRIGRRHAPSRDDSAKTAPERSNDQLKQIAGLISRVETLVSSSEKLGINTTGVKEDIEDSKAAAGRKRPKSARRHLALADRHARDAVSRGFPSIVQEANVSIRRLERVRGSTKSSKMLLEQAKSSLKDGEYVKAVRLLGDARKSIRDAEKEVVLRIIFESKDKFVSAKKAGLNIDDAVDLLNRSRDCLKTGELEDAVRYAKESGRKVAALLQRYREARYPLPECIKSIKLAEALGADVQELNIMLMETRRQFKENDLDRSSESSRKLIDLARKTAYARAAESYELAERALTLARNAGVEVLNAEESLRKARERLEKDDLAKSVSLSCASMFESNSVLLQSLTDRLKSIDEFAKGIEGEVESLTEVREAIESSKERNLENLKKFTKLSEDVVNQAYESAASYTRVSQDIIKQAYESSVAAGPAKDFADKKELPSEVAADADARFQDKRQRLVNLYLAGKISETQLDRLLLMIDSSVAKDSLV